MLLVQLEDTGSKNSGKTFFKTLIGMECLAEIYHAQGRLDKAKELKAQIEELRDNE